MTSHTPHGWQNLSPERHRTIDREQILFAIQAVHEDAEETEIGDGYLAYWLGETDDRNLIGFAWKTDHVWFFAYMNRIALDVGVHCTLDTTGRRVRILPTVRQTPAEYPPVPARPTLTLEDEHKGLKDLANALKTATEKPKRTRNAVISREVFREGGQWYAMIELKSRMRQLGPFASKKAAEEAQP
jgi:hypothetical protein